MTTLENFEINSNRKKDPNLIWNEKSTYNFNPAFEQFSIFDCLQVLLLFIISVYSDYGFIKIEMTINT